MTTFITILLFVASDIEGTTIKIGYLGRSSTSWGPRTSFNNSGSGLLIALDRVNADQDLLPNDTLEVISADDECDEKTALELLVNLTQQHGVKVIIGPTCAESCVSLGLLASRWNVPVISYFCANGEVS